MFVIIKTEYKQVLIMVKCPNSNNFLFSDFNRKIRPRIENIRIKVLKTILEYVPDCMGDMIASLVIRPFFIKYLTG